MYLVYELEQGNIRSQVIAILRRTGIGIIGVTMQVQNHIILPSSKALENFQGSGQHLAQLNAGIREHHKLASIPKRLLRQGFISWWLKYLGINAKWDIGRFY